jgi:hypothetical protein
MNNEKDNIFHKIDVKLLYSDAEWKSLLAGVDLDIMNQRQKRKRIITKTVITTKSNDKRRIR